MFTVWPLLLKAIISSIPEFLFSSVNRQQSSLCGEMSVLRRLTENECYNAIETAAVNAAYNKNSTEQCRYCFEYIRLDEL